MAFEMIVTLGPSVLFERNLRAVSDCGPCIFRINGAHVSSTKVGTFVSHVRRILPEARLMVDLPGNKIRTNSLDFPISLNKGELFELYPYQVNFPDFYRYVKKGDEVFASDSIYRFEVVEVVGSTIRLRSHSEGVLTSNKGIHIRGISDRLPFLFQEDQALIKAACEHRVNYVSLSFVRTVADVDEGRKAVANQGQGGPQLIVKIEQAAALQNLEGILNSNEMFNVDRGDLSSDIGMTNLPVAQERIIAMAKKLNKKLFLATQFLKYMETHPIPLIPEMVDLHRTLETGIGGIQLSEETAVGKYPVECVSMIFKMAQQIQGGKLSLAA
ncbi:MAG: hypothetical protein HYR96_02440 [Deltaproteobacteria bacterium]|nr:hypothetical protein [Deltaproteobacteria bacterium]MBI3295892.1 hypothetical protein [Deltaproteobacteria bacterium]